MKLVLRILIVVAAMIAGAWITGELAGRFYVPYASPDETSCCLRCGNVHHVHSHARRSDRVRMCGTAPHWNVQKTDHQQFLIVPGFVFVLWLLLGL